MSRYALGNLEDKLCKELEEIADKPELGAGDLEIAHKLTDTLKNIYKIEMYGEDGGYSRAGEWEADMRGTYGRGSSYKRDRMGRYARDDGYSRHGERENTDYIVRQLEDMMREAGGESEHAAIKKAINALRNA